MTQFVLRATAEVNRKVGNSTPAPPKTPEPIVAKIHMGDYVGLTYPYAKFHNDPITPFVPKMCENSHEVTRLVFFRFFRQRTAKTPAPIFTINTSNDVVSRKDVPFGVSKKNYISTPFSPKTEIFGQFLTGLK